MPTFRSPEPPRFRRHEFLAVILTLLALFAFAFFVGGCAYVDTGDQRAVVLSTGTKVIVFPDEIGVLVDPSQAYEAAGKIAPEMTRLSR
jgi:hypothetical protein